MIRRFETTTIYGMPVLLITPEGAARRPVIFFMHGFGSAKAAGLSAGCQLARRGFCFMSFDAWLRGERFDIYPAGHTVTPHMERDAVDWFAAHLA